METEVDINLGEVQGEEFFVADQVPAAERRVSAVAILEQTVVLSLLVRRLKPSWMTRNGEASTIPVIDSFREHLINGTGWFFSEDILDDDKLVLDLFAGLEATISGTEYAESGGGVRQRCNDAYKVLYKAVRQSSEPQSTHKTESTTFTNTLVEAINTPSIVKLKENGNCKGVDPDLFFPERGQPTAEPRRVCRGCVVRSECLEYALVNGEKFGIWGGLSERERRRLRRQRSQGTRRTQA